MFYNPRIGQPATNSNVPLRSLPEPKYEKASFPKHMPYGSQFVRLQNNSSLGFYKIVDNVMYSCDSYLHEYRNDTGWKQAPWNRFPSYITVHECSSHEGTQIMYHSGYRMPKEYYDN